MDLLCEWEVGVRVRIEAEKWKYKSTIASIVTKSELAYGTAKATGAFVHFYAFRVKNFLNDNVQIVRICYQFKVCGIKC